MTLWVVDFDPIVVARQSRRRTIECLVNHDVKTMISHPSGAVPREPLKARLKRSMQAQTRLWSIYWRSKQQIRRVLLLRYFLYDIHHTYRAMFWHEGHNAKTTLAAELLFQYHKLEKGLVMTGPRRLFGVEPAIAAMALCRRWIDAGHPRTDPVFVGAVETLASHARRLQDFSLDPGAAVLPQLLAFLLAVPERDAGLVTPWRPPSARLPGAGFESFADLALARRSVREFRPEPVAEEIMRKAALAAQLAPSACNRQPCRLTIVSDSAQRQALLAWQNGNRGFGHLAPHVAIVTADERCFFDASERHEPYIDGGLFAMSFILALRDQGVVSCCLNWCVPPPNDRQVHVIFKIPQSRRIVMLIAFGFETDSYVVPRSPRRDIAEVIEIL